MRFGKIGCTSMMLRIPPARDYVQDGLIAMWDGIENVGWGQHDNAATVWKNLAGNTDYDVTLTSKAKFVDNAMEIVNYTGPAAQASVALPANDNAYHYEIVCSYDSTVSNKALFIFAGGGYASNNENARNTVILYAWERYSRKGFAYGSPSDLYRAGTDYTFSGIHQGSGTHDFSAYDGRILTYRNLSDSNMSKNVRNVITFSFATSGTKSENPPAGFRVHTLRIYQSRLAEAARLRNYAVDKARFNLLDATT